MRGTRVPAIVPSDFRTGTEVAGRLAPSCARTSAPARHREPAPARAEPGARAGSLRMPTAAAARYRRLSARAPSPAAHYRSPSRYPGASRDGWAPRHPRVRSCCLAEATGTPRQAGASGHEKMPSTCQRLRIDTLFERYVGQLQRSSAGRRSCIGANPRRKSSRVCRRSRRTDTSPCRPTGKSFA